MIMIGTRSEKRGFSIDMSKSKGWIPNKTSAFYENSTLGKANIHCIAIKVQFSSFLEVFCFLEHVKNNMLCYYAVLITFKEGLQCSLLYGVQFVSLMYSNVLTRLKKKKNL